MAKSYDPAPLVRQFFSHPGKVGLAYEPAHGTLARWKRGCRCRPCIANARVVLRQGSDSQRGAKLKAPPRPGGPDWRCCGQVRRDEHGNPCHCPSCGGANPLMAEVRDG